MIVKLFEIRDRSTFIPMMAVSVEPRNELEDYLLRRSGYDTTPGSELLILLAGINGMERITYDPYDWGRDSRTRLVAHGYIAKNWAILESGAVIDVEWILEETKTQKVSERMGYPL